jgi:hypothetical protein
MKEYISVFKPEVARKLLKKGYIISDIKPKKESPNESIFIFKNQLGFESDLYEMGIGSK